MPSVGYITHGTSFDPAARSDTTRHEEIMGKQRAMKLVVPAPEERRVAPTERGRLWYDFEIPDRFLAGLPRITDKVRWVRAHFPRAKRVKIGRDSAWYEADIREHMARQAGAQATTQRAAS